MSKPSILIVDDEEAIRSSLSSFLDRRGFTVYAAKDGVQAIEQLLDHPDLAMVITDYRMDVLGGDYWVRFLSRFCADKKVLVTSGFLRPDFNVPFEVLYKPFDYEELTAIVERMTTSDSE